MKYSLVFCTAISLFSKRSNLSASLFQALHSEPCISGVGPTKSDFLCLIEVPADKPVASIKISFHPFPKSHSARSFVGAINKTDIKLTLAGLCFHPNKATISFLPESEQRLVS